MSATPPPVSVSAPTAPSHENDTAAPPSQGPAPAAKQPTTTTTTATTSSSLSAKKVPPPTCLPAFLHLRFNDLSTYLSTYIFIYAITVNCSGVFIDALNFPYCIALWLFLPNHSGRSRPLREGF
jgi:hypothetical protein